MNWLVELSDGTSVYHDGSIYVPTNGNVILSKPVFMGRYVQILHQTISPEYVVGVHSTNLTAEELAEQGVNIRGMDV